MFADAEFRRCEHCGRRYAYDWRKGHTRRICNSCKSNRVIPRDELKAELIAAKGGACELCGYERCQRALAFHHVDPETKRFNIAGSHLRKREDLFAEIAKCVLLCQNCHLEVHAGFVDIPPPVRARVAAAVAAAPRVPRRRPGRPARDAA